MSSFLSRSQLLRARNPPTISGRTKYFVPSRISDDHYLKGAVLSPRFMSSNTTPSSVKKQLQDLAELQSKVSSENSKGNKEVIISHYPQLRDILERIYTPNFRTNVSSASLIKYIVQLNGEAPKTEMSAEGLGILDILEMTSERKVAGNAARELCKDFVDINGLDAQETEMWYKLLDRNLTAGFGARTLQQVPWKGSSASDASPKPGSNKKSPAGSDNVLDKFSCALGKTVTPPFDELKKADKWFASRKLDGIRALALCDFMVPHNTSEQPSLANVDFVSRVGNSFTTLGKLHPQIEQLSKFPKLREWLDRDPLTLKEDEDGVVKRLVLDGEICVMIPVNSAPEEVVRHSADRLAAEHNGQDGQSRSTDPSAAAALWTEEGFIEDFSTAVSAVKRSSGIVDRPAYYLFDLLSWAEVKNKGSVHSDGLGKPFSERASELEELVDWLDHEIQSMGGEKMIKRLAQLPLDTSHVDDMVARAGREGWEGLIFRADKPYKGKRSADILKFKEWQDAEYTVVKIDTAKMRLAVDGVFQERLACSNLWFEHKGHLVSVGSGLTTEERIRYAEDPSEIIGSQITVKYFSESESKDRPGVKSLRFPRIKTVWHGKRDV